VKDRSLRQVQRADGETPTFFSLPPHRLPATFTPSIILALMVVASALRAVDQ